MKRRFLAISLAIVLVAAAAMLLNPTANGPWIATWSGVVVPYRPGFMNGMGPPPEFQNAWSQGYLDNQTVRVVVPSTHSGKRVRIRLSNEFGQRPLTVGAAHIVGLTSKPVRISKTIRSGEQGRGLYILWNTVPDSDRQILFGRQGSVIIAPGAIVVSDALDFEISDRDLIAVSLYLPEKTEPATVAVDAMTSALILSGDSTALPSESFVPHGFWSTRASPWLSSVEVEGTSESRAILVIDDDRQSRERSDPSFGWQSHFKDRLLSNGGFGRFAVLDSSLRECYLLGGCAYGRDVLDRIQDAVRNQSGVKWVVLAAGFEDILVATYYQPRAGHERPQISAEDLISALTVVSDAAHAAGMKICVVTYPPFAVTRMSTPEGEKLRMAVNSWIRETDVIDSVADFDRVLRESENPSQRNWVFANQFGSLYNDSGYRVMASTFDVSVF